MRKAISREPLEDPSAGVQRAVPKVMLIGALPPPFTGSTVPFRALIDALAASGKVEPIVIATGTKTDDGFLTRAGSFFRSLAGFLRQVGRADVVSTHLSAKGRVTLAPIVLLVCRLLGRPVIVRNFGGALDKIYATSWPVTRRLIRYVLSADYVLVETKALCAFAKGLDLGNEVVWFPNTRPVSRYTRSGPAGAVLRLVYLGAVTREKGVDLLLEAVRDLPADRVALTVYGQPGNVTLEELRALEPSVHYGGVLTPEQVCDALARHDVLVMPSKWSTEGYPGVIIEAYAAGLAVATVDLPSIREIASDGETALMFEAGSREALTRTLRRLTDDRELLKRLKSSAAEKAREYDSSVAETMFIGLCCEAAARQIPRRQGRVWNRVAK